MSHRPLRPSRVAMSLSLLLGCSVAAFAQNAGMVSSGDSLDSVIGGGAPAPKAAPAAAPAGAGAASPAFMPKGARRPAPAPVQQADQPAAAGSSPLQGQSQGGGLAGLVAPAPTPVPAQAAPVATLPPMARPQPVAAPSNPAQNAAVPLPANATGYVAPAPATQPGQLPRVVGVPTGTPPFPTPIPAAPTGGMAAAASPFAAQPATPATPVDGADASAPKPPSFTAATDALMSDDEANHKVQSLMRQMRVYNEALKVEKVRGDIAKAQSEYKKTNDALLPKPIVLPPPPPAVIPPIPAMPSIPNGKALQSNLGLRKGQVSTLSITGPRDDLKAMVRLDGVGDMQIHRGSVLPGDIKVVSIEPRGVSVRKGTSDVVLVPFAE